MTNQQTRIQQEILTDAYTPEEKQLAWYTYLSEMLDFPFRAQIRRRRRDACELLQEVEVLALEDLDESTDEQRVEVAPVGEELTFWVPLEELCNVQADDFTFEAVEDWKTWRRDGG